MLLLIVAVSACGSSDRPQTRGQAVEIRDSAGIEIVSSAMPQWDDGERWTVEPEPVLEIGTIEGDPAYQFGTVRDAIRLADGRIAVVDGRAYDVRIFDRDGSHLATFGRSGDGPGEFAQPPFLALAPPDTIVAWDAGHRRLSWFAPDGRLLREQSLASAYAEMAIESVINGSVWQVAGNGTVLSTGRGPLEITETIMETTRRVVVIADLGARTHDFGTFPHSRSYRVPDMPSSFTNSFGARSEASLDLAGSTVAVAAPNAFKIELYDLDGGLQRIMRADIPSTALTNTVLAAEVGRLTDQLSRLSERVIRAGLERTGIPDSVPPVAVLHWDAAGHLWVGRRTADDPSGFNPAEYEVFDRAGRWLGPARVPRDLTRVLEVGEDYVLASWSDEFDVQYLRVHRINKP